MSAVEITVEKEKPMNPSKNALSLRLPAMLLATVMLLLAATAQALSPATSHAQAACSLPARLQVGDAVEVIDGTANRLREGPGLAYGKLALSMVPGDVWYVLQGPICADGINWYSVGAYDAGGWTAEGQPGRGYYLGRTDRLPGGEGAVTPVCASDRLSIGMRAMVGDGRNQRVRPQPSKAAREIAWLAPGVPVTLLDGPSCADGWTWWYIRDDSGRIQGWTAEGDGPARPWLVAAWGSGSGSPGNVVPTSTPRAAAIRPTFTGSLATNWTLTPANHQTSFSLDQEAVTVFFSDFAVRAPAGGSQARRVETLTLPVRSGPRGYVAGAMIMGFVDCTGGGRATLTLQAGNASNAVTCQDANSREVILRVAQPANADLRIVITAQVWKSGPGAEPSVNVDLIDIGLEPR